MHKLQLRKFLMRKSALSAQWGTPILINPTGEAFIQLSDEEIHISGFQRIRTDRTRDDLEFVGEAQIFKQFEEGTADPQSGSLVVHCICIQGNFVIGDIVSLGEYLREKRDNKVLPDGLGYLEEDINEFITFAETVKLPEDEKDNRFIFSEREGLVRFERRLIENATRIQAYLEKFLSAPLRDGEIARPTDLMGAMHYALLGIGGKRLRPFLTAEVAVMLGGDREAATAIGAAIEMVHTASLVHDDLPALDDDDLRRGQPTVHKAHDEATAILVGDALITMAYEAISTDEVDLTDKQKLEIVLALSRASGLGGVLGGQALDLEHFRVPPTEDEIVMREGMKTGALIRASCEIGAIVANGSVDDRRAAREYGTCLAQAFQIADDLLDWVSDNQSTQTFHHPHTLVQRNGTDWAIRQLNRLITEAESILAPYGPKAWVLRDAVRFVAAR